MMTMRGGGGGGENSLVGVDKKLYLFRDWVNDTLLESEFIIEVETSEFRFL